ncbi:phage holin family protein [Patescibacteria group bacterium]|nr:phage holin family protein [Patescibacteria group bacterium]MCH8244290.1 phage holin family protein [Patescibacteria group bacterium]
MLQTIVLSLLAGLAGLWIATEFIPGVDFTGNLKSFLIAGVILGTIIAVSRPLLNLFSLVIKLVVLVALILLGVWILDILFPELSIPNLTSLLWTGVVIAGVTVVLSLFGRGKV